MPDGKKTTLSLGLLGPLYDNLLHNVEKSRFSVRLWENDPTLWKKSLHHKDIIKGALGWLSVPLLMEDKIDELNNFSGRVRDAGFRHVVLLGMGGSALAPLVFSKTFGSFPGYPDMFVLDTIDPAAVKRVEDSVDPAKTLFIVASKSGTTIEVLSLFDYFYDRLAKNHKKDSPGKNFAAITDAGSPLEKLSERLGFLRVFLNPKDIGGRYSALSYFGLVPAALIGMDIKRLLLCATSMADACSPGIEEYRNPAVTVGAALAMLAKNGKDKVTFFLDDGIQSFGLWIEQLLSESTGKEGKGIIPIVGEKMGGPGNYFSDRVFVSMGFKGKNRDLSGRLASLKRSGNPVIKISLSDKYSLGGEFFRWEVASAAAGAVFGINPFDQPDVEDAKKRTLVYLKGITGGTAAKRTQPSIEGRNLKIFFGKRTLKKLAGARPVPEKLLGKFIRLLDKDSYLSIMAYVDPYDEALSSSLLSIRAFLRDKTKVATQSGYGPRYLHSTGQLHKGGPKKGVFIFITHEADCGLTVPGRGYTFSGLEFSQAMGDMEALDAGKSPVVLFALKSATPESLKEVESLIKDSLGADNG